MDTFNAITQAVFGTPADQQAEAKEKLAKEILRAQLTNYSRGLEAELRRPHPLGRAATGLRQEGGRDQLLGAFPAVKKLVDGVSERERIKAYIARDVYSTKA